MTQLTELDYETIENAVMETARGRWFLSEFKKRHSSAETGTPALLDAINRLENIVTTISRDFPSGQAKKTIRVSPPARSKPAPSKAENHDAKPLSKENLQFFAKDEDLFTKDANALMPNDTRLKISKPAAQVKQAKTPEAAPAPSAKAPAAKVDTQNKDSKVPDLTMQPTPQERDRIVVIRSAADTDINIPLADELHEPASAKAEN